VKGRLFSVSLILVLAAPCLANLETGMAAAWYAIVAAPKPANPEFEAMVARMMSPAAFANMKKDAADQDRQDKENLDRVSSLLRRSALDWKRGSVIDDVMNK
jgi:hypothetical protein